MTTCKSKNTKYFWNDYLQIQICLMFISCGAFFLFGNFVYLTSSVSKFYILKHFDLIDPRVPFFGSRRFVLFLYLRDSLSINVAYNDDPYYFEIVNNSMLEWHDYWGLWNEEYYIPYDFEILEIFFENKIINWINCNYTWGWYDDESGRWTGAVGKVKMNTYLLK